MRIALCQIDNSVGDLAGNAALIARKRVVPDSRNFRAARYTCATSQAPDEITSPACRRHDHVERGTAE